MKAKQSPTFCVLPWVHLASKPNGTLNPCCISSEVVLKDKNSKACRLDRDPIEQIWNSPDLVEIRKKMLKGETVPGCKICYADEAHQRTSLRQMMNQRWTQRLGEDAILARQAESLEADGTLQSGPVYFDLRLGNKCNLKCRMCFPMNSNGLNQEIRNILESKTPFPQDYETLNDQESLNLQWGDSEIFLNSIDHFLPQVRELYFTGGEPMLIQGTTSILKRACELGVAKNIQLTFHTNTTTWNPAVIELLPSFLEVHVACSIDGVDSVDEYIRYPTKFSLVEQNFKRYLALSDEHKNISVGMATALSWQNIFNLPQLVTWLCESNKPRKKRFQGPAFGLVHYPTFLGLNMIPNELRPLAHQAVQDSLEILKNSQNLSPEVQNNLQSILGILKQEAAFYPNQSQDLINHTEALDHSRRQDLQTLLPKAFPVFQYHKNLLAEN